MARFKLTIEYAGTRYSGWQIQNNARTVQGELTRVVRDVTGQREFDIYGSGRTDAGVHALEQVAHLDVITAIPAEMLRRRLNDALPTDINILSLELARRRFHARHDAVARSYLYQISRRRTAFAKHFVWWVREELDLARMRSTAERFSGMKDFRSFTDDSSDDKSTLVAIERIEIAEDGDLVLIRVEGSHFLWKMVRRMVGVMVEVGRGGATIEEAERFLREDSDIPAKLTAPASGLFLERVYYSGDRQRPPLRGLVDVRVPAAARKASLAETAAPPRKSGRNSFNRRISNATG
jgi:tRNA pseudouridine38-40 synthase